jgi:hypothetical protein
MASVMLVIKRPTCQIPLYKHKSRGRGGGDEKGRGFSVSLSAQEFNEDFLHGFSVVIDKHQQ